ncbi:13710_t:CDS:2 [Funneliformis geosporum]|nr:13710_t:CDS:2 [Funneliformis geosporum]
MATEFHIIVYNTAVSGPEGILGEVIEKFDNFELFKHEENRITLPLKKFPRDEQIGEVFFILHMLSNKSPRYMMERISDPANRAKKIGILLINLITYKNLAGRRGALEIKLNDESQSTEGYWNTTGKWVYPIALSIIAKPTLDLVIQCRYTEHERASTRICLGPDGSHEHIWKRLMDGPYEMKHISLHDNDHDAAKIGLKLQPERRPSTNSSRYRINRNNNPNFSTSPDSNISRPIKPQLTPETSGTPPNPNNHHRKYSTYDDDLESQYSHVPVNYSPPRSVVDMDYDTSLHNKGSFSSSTGSPTYPPTPPQSSQSINPNSHTSPTNSIFSSPPRKQHTMSSPPPDPAQNPHPKNDGLRFVCQRYVIVNQLRLGRRREENNLLYKGNHILSGLNVIIKEFNSKISWEIETQYLKELASKHLVRWVDKSSNESTREYLSITEYYGRALQLEARKFNNESSRRQIFKSICVAIEWIHSKDVVHLDLNPSNIICKEGKENYKIRICDFETSRQIGEILQVQPILSETQSIRSYDTRYSSSQNQIFQQQLTISYTCPELLLLDYEDSFASNQNNEVEVDFNQDIYSLGLILYFLYSNRTLYGSIEEFHEKLSGFEDRIRKEIEDNRVTDLILSCISINPKERPCIEDVLQNAYFNKSSRGNSGKSFSLDDGCGEEEDLS